MQQLIKLLMAINENGPVDGWDYIESDENIPNEISVTKILSNKFGEYLKPYLKISKDCKNGSGCLYDGYHKGLHGGNWGIYNRQPIYQKFILLDGSTLWMRRNLFNVTCADSDGGYTNACGLIWFDVNGKNPPNTFGKDTFVFIILKDRIVPDRTNSCNLNKGSGYGCSNYIIKYNNMNYLHKTMNKEK